MKIWKLQQDGPQLLQTLSLNSSVTSVACAPSGESGDCILAIGTENGIITIFHIQSAGNYHTEHIWQSPDHFKHGGAVRKIKIRVGGNCTNLTMASCSSDHSVRIFEMGYKM